MSGERAPSWDPERAAALVGLYALVGVRWIGSDGETVENEGQYHGRIVEADPVAGIKIACEGRRTGETFSLPPALDWFETADAGRYTLRSTGEVIVDPDVTASWRVMKPPAE